MSPELPPELWTHIFDLAADEDVIFWPGLPTVTAQSSWFKTVFGEWQLRTPQDAINLIQRRSYATKKAVISTCKSWQRLGSEFLVRCLFFDDPTKLQSLCALLDRESHLGWWVRRIHITHFSSTRGATMDDFENPLISIVQQCPNLEIFVIEWHMGQAFGPIVDTLGTYCKQLRTVHWHVPAEALSKVIWALSFLPNLIAVHIEFDEPVGEPEAITLGAASDIELRLPNLRQLSLRGFCQQFLEQATGWKMPNLRSFSFDFSTNRHDIPDVIAFLTYHGSELLLLDLNCIPTLDVRTILDLCPSLTTFTFNLDWRLSGPTAPAHDPPADTDAQTIPTIVIDEVPDAAVLTNRPHPNITHIGLHGLLYAFGVGYAAAYASVDPLRTAYIRTTNDRNFAGLTRASFPKLQCVRALSTTLLSDLNLAGRPAEECYDRWLRWWSACTAIGVRLEDCTGAELGNLPEEEDEEEDEEEYVYEEEEEEETGGIRLPELRLLELRELLEECRKMASEADDTQPFFGWQ